MSMTTRDDSRRDASSDAVAAATGNRTRRVPRGILGAGTQRLGIRLLSLLAFVGVWELGSMTVSERYIPGPASTARAFADLFRDGVALPNLAATLERVAVSFVLALAVGIIVGTLMGVNRHVENFLDLWLAIGLVIPSLCYIVVSFMWLGLTDRAAILAIALTTFPVTAVNVWTGTKAVDLRLVEMAKSFGISRLATARRVILPQVLPYIMAATRFGFGFVWKVTVIVELLGRSDGVGFQLNYDFQNFNMPGVFAWTLLFVLVMLGIELGVLKPLERRLFKWRPTASARS